MNLLTNDVRQRVLQCSLRWIDVDSAIDPNEALAKLLKGKSGYDPLPDSTVDSFEYARVSLPDDVNDAPSLGGDASRGGGSLPQGVRGAHAAATRRGGSE